MAGLNKRKILTLIGTRREAIRGRGVIWNRNTQVGMCRLISQNGSDLH